MLCSWEGNRRSGVALAIYVSQTQWSIHLEVQRPIYRRRAPHLRSIGAWSGPLYLFTISRQALPHCGHAWPARVTSTQWALWRLLPGRACSLRLFFLVIHIMLLIRFSVVVFCFSEVWLSRSWSYTQVRSCWKSRWLSAVATSRHRNFVSFSGFLVSLAKLRVIRTWNAQGNIL